MKTYDEQVSSALTYLWSKERIGLVGRVHYGSQTHCQGMVILIRDVTPEIWEKVLRPEVEKLVSVRAVGIQGKRRKVYVELELPHDR